MFPIVILAGGLATRLRPITEKIPKAMIAIHGEPFIAHQLRLLKKNNIHDVTLCVGYLGEMIEAFVGDGSRFGMQVRYAYDGDVLLGTAGSIKKALPQLAQQFFVVYGDSYLPVDYQAVQNHFILSGKKSLMTVYKNDDQWDSSNVEFKDGMILNYDKKIRSSSMKHIDFGLGIFDRSTFDQVPENTPYDLALLYQNMLKAEQLTAFEVHQRFYEAGSLTGIQELEQLLATV